MNVNIFGHFYFLCPHEFTTKQCYLINVYLDQNNNANNYLTIIVIIYFKHIINKPFIVIAHIVSTK